MVRRHGWQLPTHTFQVAAITVFLLLAVLFYVFFAPFLGSSTLEYVAVGLYSPVAIAVLALYIRCTGIDPSDPGILERGALSSHYDTQKGGANAGNSSVQKSPVGLSASARASSVAPSDGDLSINNRIEEGAQQYMETSQSWKGVLGISSLGSLLCGCLVVADNCRYESSPTSEEDEALFCTLCNAEVGKFSKHCRSCDKCVDHFDHHCRWLNNCVGRKNYISFILLMASGLLLLVLNWGTGIAVFVRCFVDKQGIDEQIVEKLGNGFSRIPFAIIVVFCSCVALLASLPLGELFFFHLILMKKGMTTYEYVVAMRTQNEDQGAAYGEEPSMPSSPASSTTTGLSVSSSLRMQYRGAWCTPPRVFVENQDEIIPHLPLGRVPSTVDPDASNTNAKAEIRSQRQGVRISAWKLAKLDRDEATRAAAKVRERSSVLRPVRANPGSSFRDTDASSMSSKSSFGELRGRVELNRPPTLHYPFGSMDNKSDATQSTYSSPSRASVIGSGGVSPFPPLQTDMAGSSGSANAPHHVFGSQLPRSQHYPLLPQRLAFPNYYVTNASSIADDSSSDHHVASSENALAHSRAGQMNPRYMGGNIRDSGQMNHRYMGRNLRDSAFWNSHGRRGPGPSSAIDRAEFRGGEQPSRGTLNIVHESSETQISSDDNAAGARDGDDLLQSGRAGVAVPPENLTYNGTSIFFGGPLYTSFTNKQNPPSNPPSLQSEYLKPL